MAPVVVQCIPARLKRVATTSLQPASMTAGDAQPLCAEAWVDDLDDVGEMDVGELPDPVGAVAEEDASLGVIESAATGFSKDSLGEGGVLGLASGEAAVSIAAV